MTKWVVENQLARSSRPGYPAKQVDQDIVDSWIEDVRAEGIRSIICLLNDDQLPYYDGLPDSLPLYYETNGFNVVHIPVTDHQHPPVPEEDLGAIWEAFNALEKPVLIHCSAGVDRTGAAIRYLQAEMGV